MNKHAATHPNLVGLGNCIILRYKLTAILNEIR